MLRSMNALNNGQSTPRFMWYEMDTLRAGHEQVEQEEFIAVTNGQPGSTIRQAYNFTRRRKSVQRLIDGGFLTFVRHEVYPRGAECDVYKLSPSGRRAVEGFYAACHEENRAEHEAFNAKREAQQKELDRIALTAALEEQFKGNYYLPALHQEIVDSETPFIDVPMPALTPYGKDGLPVTIREYLICLWYRALPDELQKTIANFFLWSDVIGDEDAAAMLRDRLDDDDDDEGDLHSPYGRI